MARPASRGAKAPGARFRGALLVSLTPSPSSSSSSPSRRALAVFMSVVGLALGVLAAARAPSVSAQPQGSWRILPRLKTACIYSAVNDTYEAVENHPTDSPLSWRDAWAPEVGSLIRTADCRRVLDSLCQVQYTQGCDDGDGSTFDSCASNPHFRMLSSLTDSTAAPSKERVSVIVLPYPDPSKPLTVWIRENYPAPEYMAIYSTMVVRTRVNSTPQATVTSSDTLTFQLFSEPKPQTLLSASPPPAPAPRSSHPWIEVTTTTTSTTTVSVSNSSCEPFPSCVFAGPSCNHSPLVSKDDALLPSDAPVGMRSPIIPTGLAAARASAAAATAAAAEDASWNSTGDVNTSPYIDTSVGPIFHVTQFGAKGDGKTDDKRAFLSAFAYACHYDGPEPLVTVLVPADQTFVVSYALFLGPCNTPVVFQVDGNVTAPSDPDVFLEDFDEDDDESYVARALLYFRMVDSLWVIGNGTLNGRGQRWWDMVEAGHEVDNRPILLEIGLAHGVVILDLNFVNSSAAHVNINSCRNVVIYDVHISSPPDSPNTDGIHVTRSTDVTAAHSLVSCGDDNFSIEAGTSNVLIYNVWCDGGHGISIGSLGDRGSTACVFNVTVNRAVLLNMTNGLRIKTYQGGNGSVHSISYRNVYMENVERPIVIDQDYCDRNTPGVNCDEHPLAVAISNVTYSTIVGYTPYPQSGGISIACSSTVPCIDVTLSEVNITSQIPGEELWPVYDNVYGSLGNNVYPRPMHGSTGPLDMDTLPFKDIRSFLRMVAPCGAAESVRTLMPEGAN